MKTETEKFIENYERYSERVSRAIRDLSDYKMKENNKIKW